MKPISAIACLSLLAAPLYGDSGQISELLPDVELDSVRIVPVFAHEDALLTVSISYKKQSHFDGLDQYDIVLIPKERWQASGFGRSRINHDGEGFQGGASIRNVSPNGFKIHFDVAWKTRDAAGVFTPILDAKWMPVQNFEVDGVPVTVTISKKK